MPLKEIVDKVKNGLGDQIKSYYIKGNRRFYMIIKQNKIHDTMRYLLCSLEGRLSTISAVDKGNRFELIYHITFDKDGVVGSFKYLVPKFNSETPSITSITPAANWIEREIHDLFGINFIGHPFMERLILPDDWPKDKHPLRREA
jgi:Ni,Fe-hydrogenase III component G